MPQPFFILAQLPFIFTVTSHAVSPTISMQSLWLNFNADPEVF